MPDRMPEKMSEIECQIECQKECQIRMLDRIVRVCYKYLCQHISIYLPAVGITPEEKKCEPYDCFRPFAEAKLYGLR